MLQPSPAGMHGATKPQPYIAGPLKFLDWKIPPKAHSSAFVHVNVIPMDRQQVFPDQTVVIEEGHIATIGATRDIPVPANAVVIDGTGKYLIPGLVDMHVQVCGPGELLLYLANGVTMVRNVNSRPQHLVWRDKIDQGMLLGPIIYAAGPTISEAATSIQAKRVAMDQIRSGYDAIEAGDNLSPEVFRGITTVARATGWSVFGGVNITLGLKGTVAGPQFFSLESADQFARIVFRSKLDTADVDISRAAAEIRNGNVWFTPMLASYGNAIEQSEDSRGRVAHPETRFLPAWTRRERNPPQHNCAIELSKEEHPFSSQAWVYHKKIVSTLHREHVSLILGTGSMAVGTLPGFSVQQELVNLVEAGLTPFEALQAATKTASEWFVHPEGGGIFGTITLHERADLVLLDASPLADVRNVSKVRGVMSQGRWLSRSDLDTMLNSLPAAYENEAAFLTSAKPDILKEYLAENDPYHGLADYVLAKLADIKGMKAATQMCSALPESTPAKGSVDEGRSNDLGCSPPESGKKP